MIRLGKMVIKLNTSTRISKSIRKTNTEIEKYAEPSRSAHNVNNITVIRSKKNYDSLYLV